MLNQSLAAVYYEVRGRLEGSSGQNIRKKGVTKGLCFKPDSYELCSLAGDRCMKVWDVSQMGYMENFFGHRSTGLQLDALNSENMVSCGFDRVAIVWKIPQQYQLVFKERSYSLDTVVALDQRHFATGSQDGEVCLYSLDKVKPMSSVKNAHPGGWIGALATNYNSDMLVSGGWDDQLNFYQLDLQKNSIEKKFDVRCVDCK